MIKKSILISIATSSLLYSASMEGLGDLSGGAFSSNALGISNDGSVVVGFGTTTNPSEAFRWTDSGGMVSLGDISGGAFGSGSYASNSDGSVIVGFGYSASGREAFRWTQAGGMVGLGDLAGGSYDSFAYGVNSDGSVVVGVSTSANGIEAFRWTQAGGMVGLGDLAGGAFDSRAQGVNSDGSVVIGYSTSASGTEAFRWTQAGGMVGLGDLAGGAFQSLAYGTNSDGSIVIGQSTSANGAEAFKWTQAGGMVGLGDLAGGSFSSSAKAINSDGTVIVGKGTTASGTEAFRWTESSGMQSLTDWLAEDGYTLTGWSDTQAQGVSDDGNTIVGFGTSSNGTEAFIAKAGQGMVSIADLSTSLESINTVGSQGVTNASILLHGAHGHPGQRRALDDKRVMWIAGDLSTDNRHNTKDDNQLAEIGVSFKHSEALTYSIAVGQLWGKSDLEYKGDMDTDGYFLALDTDIKLPTPMPLYLTLTGVYGKSDVTIKRGYDNAGNREYSTGNTNQKIMALKAKLQHQGKQHHPYIQYNMIKSITDGYSESGGGFPAIYNQNAERVQDWRIGVDSNFKLDESNTIITTAEAVHRVNARGSGVSGRVVGLNSFDIAGREYDQDWLRGTVGIEHTFKNKSKFTVTLNTTTEGEEPRYWSGFNYSIGF